MTRQEKLSSLWDRMNALNAEIKELSTQKYEIEDRIDALTGELDVIKKEASGIKKAMWDAAVGRSRCEQAAVKEGV
jgi:chromosome segregation ATPase